MTINIITSDGHTVKLDTYSMFDLIVTFVEMHPDEDTIHIDVPYTFLELVRKFVFLKQTPTTTDDWLHIISASRYLLLEESYLKDLMKKFWDEK
jgi:hypothetical protein